MSTALAIVAANTGASEEDIKNVISGMIISAKAQHGAVATNAELAVFTGVCSKYQLNPLVKECAAFISGGKLQVIVMIDGWYRMVNRQETFDGVEFDDNLNDKGEIVSITCRMYIKGRSRPACATEYMAECVDIKSSVWKRWPNRMLRHKAYIQAARIAFGISEVIDEDEAGRIRSNTPAERDITPKPSVNFTDINTMMSDCKNLDDLDKACAKIKNELQTNSAWESVKAEMIALKIKHRDRINKLKSTVGGNFDKETGECRAPNQEAESVAAQAIEGELLSAGDGVTSSSDENVDTAFGDDDDDIGFGDETNGSFETVTDEFGGEV